MSCVSIRPFVGVYKGKDEPDSQVPMPAVFKAPIRPDIVSFVHDQMFRNSRQAHGVSTKAGHQTSAESWGTGRAVARIPRVRGGGTHRSGQGAFGNMCRGGHMFAPIRTYRKWAKKINLAQKRIAVTSIIAASGSAGMVMSKGHVIDRIPEVPLVVSDKAQEMVKTKEAVDMLRRVNAWSDVLKVYKSERRRAGIGKMRNRRKIHKTGPLIIYNRDQGLTQAFRNIPGVETMCIHSLNLLMMAPGGHLGRFMIWTESAFRELDNLWGTYSRGSAVKKGFVLPLPKMANTDLTRLIRSDEIQSVIRAPKKTVIRKEKKSNPLVNRVAMLKLNPYSKMQKKIANSLEAKSIKQRELDREVLLAGAKDFKGKERVAAIKDYKEKKRAGKIQKKADKLKAKLIAKKAALLAKKKTHTQKRNEARNSAVKARQEHKAARYRKMSAKKAKTIAKGNAKPRVQRPMHNPKPSNAPRPAKKPRSRYFRWYDNDTKPTKEQRETRAKRLAAKKAKKAKK